MGLAKGGSGELVWRWERMSVENGRFSEWVWRMDGLVNG